MRPPRRDGSAGLEAAEGSAKAMTAAVMLGVGVPIEEAAPARGAMASDIADALAAERGASAG
jgi:hypothetical protein